jgi:hypothetical protein
MAAVPKNRLNNNDFKILWTSLLEFTKPGHGRYMAGDATRKNLRLAPLGSEARLRMRYDLDRLRNWDLDTLGVRSWTS